MESTELSSSTGQKSIFESKKPRKSKNTSSSSNPDPIELLRRQSLCLLRESNALLPIYRLPPEVLSSIFVIATDDECEDHKTTHMRVYISSVSHHWRGVAISTVALWRDLFLHESLFDGEIQACSERLHGQPLRLHLIGPLTDRFDYGCRDIWDKRLAQDLVDLLGRAESFEVNATPSECFGLDFPDSATLTHLKLNDPSRGTRRAYYFWGNEPHTIMNQLDTKFPGLRLLELVDHGVRPDDMHFPSSLVSLHIANSVAQHWSEDVADVLDVLRNLHNLERLSLAHAMTDFETPNALEHLDTVSLPRLKDFSFEGQVSTCIALTKALQLPSSVRRKLVVHQLEGDSDRYDTHSDETTKVNALRLYNELINELAKLESHFANAFVLGDYGTLVLAWKHNTQSFEDLGIKGLYFTTGVLDYNRNVKSSCPADLELRFIGPRHVREADALRLELLLAQARILTIYSPPSCSLNTPSLFGYLDKLEVLTYAFADITRYDQNPRVLEDLTKHRQSLPHLRSLCLRRYSFVKRNYDKLLTVCRQRQEMGAALDVQLKLCYEVTDAKIDELSAMTKSVGWDRAISPFLWD
ncbi:hypothetical protein EIP86_000999 [Pleurotus ostreatoroseus]|nr:hypothetical protein EIP86_000999 [Pleurotus ostreatoroseus]